MKINDHLSDILLTGKRYSVIIPKSFEHTLKWKPVSSKWASQISREETTGSRQEDTLAPTPLYPTQHLWLMISLCELKICLSSILKCHTFHTLKHVLTNGWIGREQIKEKHTWLESLVYRVTCHNLTFPLNRPGLCKPDEIRHVNAALPHRPAAQYGAVSGVKQGMVGKSGQLRVSSNMSNSLCISSLKTSHSPLWRFYPKSNVLVYITLSGACFISKFIKFHHSICHCVIDIITTLSS